MTVILGRANDHVVAFFRQLRWETSFYVGCVQRHERLTEIGLGVCWPEPTAETTGHQHGQSMRGDPRL